MDFAFVYAKSAENTHQLQRPCRSTEGIDSQTEGSGHLLHGGHDASRLQVFVFRKK